MKNSQKGFILPAIVFLIALIIGGSAYYIVTKDDKRSVEVIQEAERSTPQENEQPLPVPESPAITPPVARVTSTTGATKPKPLASSTKTLKLDLITYTNDCINATSAANCRQKTNPKTEHLTLKSGDTFGSVNVGGKIVPLFKLVSFTSRTINTTDTITVITVEPLVSTLGAISVNPYVPPLNTNGPLTFSVSLCTYPTDGNATRYCLTPTATDADVNSNAPVIASLTPQAGPTGTKVTIVGKYLKNVRVNMIGTFKPTMYDREEGVYAATLQDVSKTDTTVTFTIPSRIDVGPDSRYSYNCKLTMCSSAPSFFVPAKVLEGEYLIQVAHTNSNGDPLRAEAIFTVMAQ